MPYSKSTQKDFQTIFYRTANHTDQYLLEHIAPPLLKDLAAEDPSIKTWPQDIIAYLAVYLTRKCDRNSSPEDVLLAGLLLRFIDSDNGLQLQPFDRSQKATSYASFTDARIKLANVIGASRHPYLELYTARYSYPYTKPALEILQKTVLFLQMRYMYYFKCQSKAQERKKFRDVITESGEVIQPKNIRDPILLKSMWEIANRHVRALWPCIDRFTKELNATLSSLKDFSPDEYTKLKIRFLIEFNYYNILTPDAGKNLVPVLVNYANKQYEQRPDTEPEDPLLDELVVFFADTFRNLRAKKPTVEDDITDKEDKNFRAFRAYNKATFIIRYIAENASLRVQHRIRAFLDIEISNNDPLYAEVVQELLRGNNLLSSNSRAKSLKLANG